MDKPYTVALIGWPELPAAAKIAAEVRFATEFERLLGGSDRVMPAWVEHEITVEEIRGPADMRPLETAYAQAIAAASDAGWRGLAERPLGAAFRVWTDGDDELA